MDFCRTAAGACVAGDCISYQPLRLSDGGDLACCKDGQLQLCAEGFPFQLNTLRQVTEVVFCLFFTIWAVFTAFDLEATILKEQTPLYTDPGLYASKHGEQER